MDIAIDTAALEGMKYAELQRLAKQIGVKANMKVLYGGVKYGSRLTSHSVGQVVNS